jgi:ribosomal protein L18E
MKFKNLKSEFELLVETSQEAVELASLETLKDEIEEKKAKFTRKLKKGISLSRRDSVEVKLEDLQHMLKTIKTVIAEKTPD